MRGFVGFACGVEGFAPFGGAGGEELFRGERAADEIDETFVRALAGDEAGVRSARGDGREEGRGALPDEERDGEECADDEAVQAVFAGEGGDV